jgi:hypothetical protein
VGTNHVDPPERQIPKEEDPRELDRHAEPLEHQTRPRQRLGGGAEVLAESDERPPIGRADEDEGPRGLDVPTPEEEGERYAAINAVPAKAAPVGEGAAQLAKISTPEVRR